MDSETTLALCVVFGMLLIVGIGFALEMVNLVFSGLVLLAKVSVKLIIIGVVLGVVYYGHAFFNDFFN